MDKGGIKREGVLWPDAGRLTDWGFMSNLTQNRSFWRRSLGLV